MISARRFKLPKLNFKPKPYKGPSPSEISKISSENVNPILKTFYKEPILFNQGYMQWLFDHNGKRYLDMFGGICTVSVGHCHPKITRALSEQLESLVHVSSLYQHPKLFEYSQKLADHMPGDLKVVYLLNSGSEANDLAILLSRLYTGNDQVLSLKNCYHGMTYQTMGLTSNSHYKYTVPPPAAIHNVMNPDVFRGPWGGSKCRNGPAQTSRNCSSHCDTSTTCNAGENYLKILKTEFESTIPRGKLAAFFAESIQGVGGCVQFPKNYIKGAYEIVKEHNGLFVSDEVQTGFGRTGDNFWGFQDHGIVPDIVTMAKGIGNGFPMSALITTKDISNALTEASHFNTFGGNPLACTVGSTVLDIISEEKLQENCKKIGTHLLNNLDEMKRRNALIGDVRGRGLMIGVELVENDGNFTPLSIEKFSIFFEKCKEMGLLVGIGGFYKNVLRIKPPMCITEADADFTLEVIEESLRHIH